MTITQHFELQSSHAARLRTLLANLPKLKVASTSPTLSPAHGTSQALSPYQNGGYDATQLTRVRTLCNQLPKLVIEEPLRVFPHNDVKTIHLFPKLPVELRRTIWSWAANTPREIDMDYGTAQEFQHDEIRYRYHIEFCVSGRRLPSILQVNQESRKEALRYFQLVHEEDFMIPHTTQSQMSDMRNQGWTSNTIQLKPFALYLNFHTDWFGYYLNVRGIYSTILCAPFATKIRNLRISYSRKKLVNFESVPKAGAHLRGLKQVDVALHNETFPCFPESVAGHLVYVTDFKTLVDRAIWGKFLQNAPTAYTTSLTALVDRNFPWNDTELYALPCDLAQHVIRDTWPMSIDCDDYRGRTLAHFD